MTRQSYVFTSESVSEGHPELACLAVFFWKLPPHCKKLPELPIRITGLAAPNLWKRKLPVGRRQALV